MTQRRTPDRTRTVGVRMTDAELAAIDAARGTSTRSDYVRGAVAEAIARRPTVVLAAGPVPTSVVADPTLRVVGITTEPPLASVAVTPPGADTTAMRAFIWANATGRYVDLSWRDETDEHGAPMGRLYGRRA